MRMIPSFIDQNSPPGEIEVYTKLQASQCNWTVLHSLDLAPWNKFRRTEIDFVIIMPDLGILCIEVKSQKNIYFDGNFWQPESIKRSPFKQALDGRGAFYRRLKDGFSNKFSHLPVMHLCIFPHSDYDVPFNAGVMPFEVIDRRAYLRCKDGDTFAKNISSFFIQAVENDPDTYKLKNGISKEDVDNIVDFCFPIRKRKPEKHDEIKQKNIELTNKLREQQKPVINLVSLNDRVLVEGGAGTGKSLIGMEVAKRKAAEGIRVAYLCFNTTIGAWAEKELSATGQPNLVAGSLLRILTNMTGITVPNNPDQSFWNEIPNRIQEKLTDPDIVCDALFDYIVVDEAQDILARQELTDCLELIINKGLDKGSYLFLGDFVNQVLRNGDVLHENLTRLRSFSTRWHLYENCRNYRSIGSVALALAAADKTTYSGYLRQGGGPDSWSLTPYTDQADQSEKVRGCVLWAKNAGFRDSDITILTFCSVKESVMNSLFKQNFRADKASEFDSNNIRYLSINAYKGMENKVIIITDVVLSRSEEFHRNLFYIGMTRATEKLFILCRESSMAILQDWVD